MKNIAIRRLRILPVPTFGGKGITERQKIVVKAELASLGYSISNPAMLDSVSSNFFLDYHSFIKELIRMRGGDVDYVPLFSNFPNIPDDNDYFTKRVMGFMWNLLGLYDESVGAETRLNNGLYIPDWLFDLGQFGADPVTQFQDASLFAKGKADQDRRGKDGHVEWISLELVPDANVIGRLQGYVQTAISAKSSIKEKVKEDLLALLPLFAGHMGVDDSALDFSKVTFRETNALLLKFFWEQDKSPQRDFAVRDLAKSPTDLLRLFAALTGSDTSLSAKIKFPKFGRPDRRLLCYCLSLHPGLLEDLSRYPKLWLAAARYFHPGDYRHQYENVADAFRALAEGKRESFSSTTEALIKAKDIKGILSHLRDRPTLFARKLHEILRKFPDATDDIVSIMTNVSSRVPLKNLLVLSSYFNTVNHTDTRVVTTKSGKMFISENPHQGELSNTQVSAITKAIQSGMKDQILQRDREKHTVGDSWIGKKIWSDPALIDLTIPLQQRSASDGLLTLGRGSRIPIDRSKTLRLFVYWKERGERTDLDLSALFLDEDFNHAGQVSYTHLRYGGIIHSGDIQSAPHGAAEFIDIPPSEMKLGERRYIAVSVHKYSGSNFNEIDCHAGWSVRDDPSVDRTTFDIATVQNKFDISTPSSYHIPMMLDLWTGEIILTDLHLSGSPSFKNVEGSYKTTSAVCRAINNFTTIRPTMHDLVGAHHNALDCVQVNNRDEADICIGLDEDCLVDCRDTEKVLSELL